MKNRVFFIILTMILAAGIVLPSGAVFAADETPSKDEMVLQLQKQQSEAFGFREPAEAEEVISKAESYPAKYDLRDVDGENYVTPVRFQNPFGTCWGFAAIAAAETSLLGSGLAQRDGYGVDTLNLSEKHLVTFLVNPVNDEDNPQNGEGLHYYDSKMTLVDKLNMGGTPVFATSLFSSGMGPVLEDRDPILEYHGKNMETEKRKDSEGNWYDFCYSDDDDWSVPESYRHYQSYVLKESYLLPSPATAVADQDPTVLRYEYDPAGTAAIKEQLMNRRAVQISFHADQSMPDQVSDGKYISKNWAHYTNDGAVTNHAVTIVGWDDDYPRENFVEGKEPPADLFPDGRREGETTGGNGAWLVKNSWGSGENEFPNRGRGAWGILNDEGEHTGYFWLSYYDHSLGMVEALSFDKSNVDEGYILAQHDYMPVNQYMSTDLDKETKMANVFKADVCETLEQISFQTTAPGTAVDYQIYLLRPGYSDPQDGVLVASGGGAYEYGGFHKMKIEPQIIQRGQYYSIVITETTPEGKYCLNCPAGYKKEMAEVFGVPCYSVGVINPGESYVLTEGKWKDYSDEQLRVDLIGGVFYTLSADNFPIKGFCSLSENIYMTVATGNSMSLVTDNDVTGDNVMVKLKGALGKLPENSELEWEASIGGGTVFDMIPNPDDSSMCKVVPKAAGTGYIRVSNESMGSQIIRIDVKEPNTLSVMGKTAAVGFNQKSQTVAVSKVLSFTDKGQGALTYSIEKEETEDGLGVDGFDVDYDTGNVIIQKGQAMGGYNLEVEIRAAGDATHAPAKQYVTFKIRITKGTNTLSVKGGTAKVKYSKLKKKRRILAASKVLKFADKGQGTKKYTLVSAKKGKKNFKKYFKVNAKNGKLTIKKGLKKGTYKVKMKVRAAGNKNYKAGAKDITITVEVS